MNILFVLMIAATKNHYSSVVYTCMSGISPIGVGFEAHTQLFRRVPVQQSMIVCSVCVHSSIARDMSFGGPCKDDQRWGKEKPKICVNGSNFKYSSYVFIV